MAVPADRIVRVATVQMTCGDSQKQNISKAVARVRQAAALKADVVCLQELFNAPYPCQSEDHDRFQWAE
ncbi:MAG TPA: nitrilase-related carbon-nitrogen hydrolase, partial [Pirellula sp.]|nr:nitrilase-related carbon-nitrogen hydrolase [Pirellula sp.]